MSGNKKHSEYVLSVFTSIAVKLTIRIRGKKKENLLHLSNNRILKTLPAIF